MQKTPKQLERYFKGVSNHRRIQILLLISEKGSMTLIDIAENLKISIATASEHTIRLVRAGLLKKEYKGKYVFHTISPYGEKILTIFSIFDK